MLLGHGPNKAFLVPVSCGATDGTIENDLNDLFWLFADNLAGVLDFLIIKKYFQFLNRLYDITWFGAVYA